MYTRADLYSFASVARPPGRSGAPRLVDELWPFARRVASAWDHAEAVDTVHADSWHALAEQTDHMFGVFAERLAIDFVADDPYPNLEAISDEVLDHGRLAVWTGASEHPLWSCAQNWRFRAVHDLIPHVAKSRSIDLFGEIEAFHDHLAFCDASAEVALFTEVVVYACIFYTRGRFPERQKAAAFPELLDEYRRRFWCG